MTANDELLAALAAEDPARCDAHIPPPAQVLASILAQPTPPAFRVRRLRLIALSAPAIALVVAVIVVVASLLRPQSAFATWSAEPGSIDPAFATAMQRNCALPPSGETGLTEEERILAELPLVVMDQRGRAAVALYAEHRPDGQATVMCMTIAAEQGDAPAAGGGGWGLGGQESPADGPLRLVTAQRNDSDAGTYTAYAGSVDASVARVNVERNDGSKVVATVADGYFLVWWPGEAFATRFIGESTEGAAVAEIGNNGWDFAVADEPDGGCLPLVGVCVGSPARDLPPIDTAISGELIEGADGQPVVECRGLSHDRCTSVGTVSSAPGGVPHDDVERVVVSCYGEPCTESGGAFRIDVVLRDGGSREVGRGGYGDYTP